MHRTLDHRAVQRAAAAAELAECRLPQRSKADTLAHYSALAKAATGWLLAPHDVALNFARIVGVSLNGMPYDVMVDAEGERIEAIKLNGAWHTADMLAADFRAALDEAYAVMPL